MPVAVSDASVLIHLSLIEHLDLLHAFYDRVLIPAAVWREVVDEGKGRAGAQAVRQAVEAGGIEVMSVPDERLARVLKRTLDEGEAEALVLALTLEADDVTSSSTNHMRAAWQSRTTWTTQAYLDSLCVPKPTG